jgi:hypothetical protein
VQSLLCHLAALSACCLFLAAAAAGDIVVPIREDVWQKAVFPPEGVSAEEAADFAIIADPIRGDSLSVGPWRQGQWGARYQCRDSLSILRGIVHGLYRTEGIEANAVTVSVQFFRGEERINVATERLGPAEEWTPFEVVFRRTPPGADSTRLALGLGRQTEGRALFTGLSVSPGVPPLVFPEEPPAVTRPAPPTDFERGKYFRIVERDGVWWLVSPSGKGFYSVGTDGPWYVAGDVAETKDPKHVAWLRRLHANSLAGWTDIKRWARINDELVAQGEIPFATFITMETGTERGDFDHLLDADGQTQSENHAFPDPFDPRFEEAYRARVRRTADLVRGRSWHAAWFVDNELAHRDLHLYPYSEHCAAAFRKFLETRYTDHEGLNEAWGTDFVSFQDVIDRRPAPQSREGAMYEDFYAFSREIVKKYVEVTLGIVRSEDPGRLVFSPRFMFGDFDYLDLYSSFDAIAVNRYPDNNTPGLDERTVELLRTVHRQTGRPIIIGEWSVPALDSGLYDDPDRLDWSWPQTVETQTDRARQAACVTTDFYNLPFMIGAHWFIWYDFDSEKRKANRGIFTAKDEPYVEVIDALARAHERIGPAVLSDPYSQ